MAELNPSTIGRAEVVRELATVTVLYVTENRARGIVNLDFDFCNPRKPFTQFKTIIGTVATQLMKVELLIEIQIDLGPLARSRVTRVIETLAAGCPGKITASRSRACSCIAPRASPAAIQREPPAANW